MYKNLKEFYDNIENQFDDDNFYKRLVESYSDVYDYKFKRSIPMSSKLNSKNNEYFFDTFDEYYVYLFNIWKDNILDLDDNMFDYLNNGKSIMKEINILKDYLRCCPPPRTAKDVFECMNPDTITMMDIIQKYGFDNYNLQQWNYISSDIFFNNFDSSYPTEHFFAINTNYYDTLHFCKLFQEKCAEQNLPFSYSFYLGNDIQDNIIIQTDTNHLLVYLEIIEKIGKDNPDLIERCSEPSIFTGKVNNYIGYGSQNILLNNDFYGTRIKHATRSIELVISEYLKKNYKKKIKGNKNSIFLIDYISGIITLNYIEFLKTSYRNQFSNLNDEELNSKKLYEHIAKYVKRSLIKQFDNGKSLDDLDDFYVYYKSNNNRYYFRFYKNFVYNVIRENSPELFNTNNNLYAFLKRIFKRTAISYGISDKYSFNIESIDDFINNDDSKVLILNSNKSVQ